MKDTNNAIEIKNEIQNKNKSKTKIELIKGQKGERQNIFVKSAVCGSRMGAPFFGGEGVDFQDLQYSRNC